MNARRKLALVQLALSLLFFGALALLLGGCGTPLPPSADEIDAALAGAWEGVFGQPRDARPTVNMALPDCEDALGNSGLRQPSTGACLLGWYGQDGVHAVWWGSFERTAFAHELLHAAIWNTTPPELRDVVAGDPQHRDPRWQTLLPRAVEFGILGDVQ